MPKNMPANNPNIAENEAKKMDNRYASLKEDYQELQQEVSGLRKKLQKGKYCRKRLEAEVRFLRSRKIMLESRKLLELRDPEPPTNPQQPTKDYLKMMCKNRSNNASIEGLPVEHGPITYGSHSWLQLGKSQHNSSVPETTAGAQSLNLERQQPAIRKPAIKKRRLQSNDAGQKKVKKSKEKGQQKPIDEGSDNSFRDKNDVVYLNDSLYSNKDLYDMKITKH